MLFMQSMAPAELEIVALGAFILSLVAITLWSMARHHAVTRHAKR